MSEMELAELARKIEFHVLPETDEDLPPESDDDLEVVSPFATMLSHFENGENKALPAESRNESIEIEKSEEVVEVIEETEELPSVSDGDLPAVSDAEGEKKNRQ
jgi:hypothetical protein